MRIHHKLFITVFLFSSLLVVILVLAMQWSIGKGMVDYVNTQEKELLTPLTQYLASEYQSQQSWQFMLNEHKQFSSLLHQYLQGSEFSPPRAPSEGDRRRQPPRRANRERPNDEMRERRRQNRSSDAPFARPPKREFSERFKDDFRDRPPRKGDALGPRAKAVSYAIVDENKSFIVGDFPPERDYSYSPIDVNEKTVGYLAISKRHALADGYELDFIQQQQSFLWLVSAVLLFLVVIVTLPFSRHILAPVRQLTRGMHQLTQGNYQQQIKLERNDELADLSRDFNELALTLESSETARKRWLANISNELRTPVAIVKGELEAMLDGVRQLSLKNINSAHQETKHLTKLIDDLHALTSADIGGMTYRKNDMSLNQFIEDESNKLTSYLAQKNIKLTLVNSPKKVSIFADETRLCQLIENIANNIIKYAEGASKARLSLIVDKKITSVVIQIEDDGLGVEPQHLPHLFEHLYRVDDARTHSKSGTGLGLSICAHIVAAHEGEISAFQSTLGGLGVMIKLPIK